MDKLTEAVRGVKTGNEESFRELYDLTNKTALAVIRRYCDVSADYEDILQETYIKVYRSIKDLEKEDKAQAWINKIAANTAIRHNMKKRPTLFTEMADEEGRIPDFEDENENANPEAVADKKAVTSIINEIMKGLPEDQRDALWMVYGQRISIREMAESLGISENTIKSRLFQGRKKLLARKEDFRKLGIEISIIPVSVLISVAFNEEVYASVAMAAGGAMAGAGLGAAAGNVTETAITAAASVTETAVSTGAVSASAGASSGLGAAAVTGGTASAGTATSASAAGIGTAAAGGAATSAVAGTAAASTSAGSAAAAAGIGAKIAAMSVGAKVAAAGVAAVAVAGAGIGGHAIVEKIQESAGGNYAYAATLDEIADFFENGGDYYDYMRISCPDAMVDDIEDYIDGSLIGSLAKASIDEISYEIRYEADIRMDGVRAEVGDDARVSFEVVSDEPITGSELEDLRLDYEGQSYGLSQDTMLYQLLLPGSDIFESITGYLESHDIDRAYRVSADMICEGSKGSLSERVDMTLAEIDGDWVVYEMDNTGAADIESSSDVGETEAEPIESDTVDSSSGSELVIQRGKDKAYPGDEVYVLHYDIYNFHNCVPLRSAPSENGDIIVEIPVNNLITYLGDSQNGFVKVEFMGLEGFVLGEYLIAGYDQMYTDAEGTVVNCDGSIIMRSTERPDGMELMEIPLGESVTLVDRDNDTYKVIYDGVCGFVPAANLYLEPTGELRDIKEGRIVNCEVSTALREEGNISSGEVCQIPVGSTVYQYNMHGFSYGGTGFYPIIYDGQMGYVEEAYLSFDMESPIEESESTSAENLPAELDGGTAYPGDKAAVWKCEDFISLRNSPDTSAQVITEIPLNNMITFMSDAENGFAKVEFMGYTGYALKEYLNIYNNEMYTDAVGTVVNCNESITLRSAPDTGARELMQIPLGAEVTYVARRGDFYEVIYDVIYGYALASYIYIEPTESAGRIVNCDESVALMKSPDLSSGELCQVPLNAPVHYITTYGYDFTDMDWYLVIYDGMVGYIYGDHVQWD